MTEMTKEQAQAKFRDLISWGGIGPELAQQLRELIALGADASSSFIYVDAGSCNATELAVKSGNLTALHFLHDIGVDLAIGTGSNYKSPLHMALAYSLETSLTLIRLGAIDRRADEALGYTLMHYAAMLGRDEVIAPLASAGLCIEDRSRKGETPLLLVQDAETLEALLGVGANINAAKPDGTRLIHSAVARARGVTGAERKVRLVAALIGRGADLEAPDSLGKVPREEIERTSRLSGLHVFKSYLARRAALEALAPSRELTNAGVPRP